MQICLWWSGLRPGLTYLFMMFWDPAGTYLFVFCLRAPGLTFLKMFMRLRPWEYLIDFSFFYTSPTPTTMPAARCICFTDPHLKYHSKQCPQSPHHFIDRNCTSVRTCNILFASARQKRRANNKIYPPSRILFNFWTFFKKKSRFHHFSHFWPNEAMRWWRRPPCAAHGGHERPLPTAVMSARCPRRSWTPAAHGGRTICIAGLTYLIMISAGSWATYLFGKDQICKKSKFDLLICPPKFSKNGILTYLFYPF